MATEDDRGGGHIKLASLSKWYGDQLVLRPKVLLLDEPLGALDAKLRRVLQGELRSLHRCRLPRSRQGSVSGGAQRWVVAGGC